MSAFAAIMVAAVALSWWGLQRPQYRLFSEPDRANVQLQVTSSAAWPLVIYLQGEGLAQPRGIEDRIGRIESVNGRFSPWFQVVPATGEVTVLNRDTIAHNTHVLKRGQTIFNIGLPLPDVIVNKTLSGSGMFSVRCDLHPNMQAWMFAPPSRHFSIVHEPGPVNFSDIAPGEYVLHLWQASGAERLHVISLEAGESKTLYLRGNLATDLTG